jgi:hypothetical protein
MTNNQQLQMWTTQYHDETVIAYSAEDAQTLLLEHYTTKIGEIPSDFDNNQWQALAMTNDKLVVYHDRFTPEGFNLNETKKVYEWINQEGRGHFSTANW